MEYVYSLDGEQYYPCGRITKPKNLFKLAKKEFNIKDYLEDNNKILEKINENDYTMLDWVFYNEEGYPDKEMIKIT